MNVHLVNDEKFINQSVIDFESFCPNENIFVVDKPKSSVLKYVTLKKNILRLDLSDRDTECKIISFCNNKIDNVFIHGLSSTKAYTALELKKKFLAKIHWICYGGDLYGYLFIMGKYELFDQKRYFRRLYSSLGYLLRQIKVSFYLKDNLFAVYSHFFKELDFFDSWNIHDYYLFKQNFISSAQLRPFIYRVLNENDFIDDFTGSHKSRIMVNQSASNSGNHITILRRIKNIDFKKELVEVIVPVSYGNNKRRNEILKYGHENLDYCFTPLHLFFSKEEYLEILRNVKCAVFGHRRQEAAGNIFILLSLGVKIFLRRDNNLLKYFKEKGYCIYEFETDLNNFSDLSCLSIEEQKTNRELVKQEFSIENFAKQFKELFP
jgi:dTDP-N-acetylfucosamine:lipid II N-acetylfucosaminyltransferase